MGVFIGIDPGENTGIAIVRDGVLAECHTLPIHKAMDLVKKEHYAALTAAAPVRFLVIFEDARQRKWFPQERNNSEYRGRLMGAGAAKRDARIWEDYLTDLAVPFEAHKPKPGLTKWEEDYWKRVTGYKGRTSYHARDAAMLVLGYCK